MLKKIFIKFRNLFVKKKETKTKSELDTILSTEWFLTNIPLTVSTKEDIQRIINFINYVDAHISAMDYAIYNVKTTKQERLMLTTIIVNSINSYIKHEDKIQNKLNMFILSNADKLSEETVLQITDYSLKHCLELRKIVESYNSLISILRKE